MREAFYGIVAKYTALIGTSKILILFLVSILALILIDENETDDKRRLPNPAVFLLSLWSGISFAVVRLIRGKKRLESVAIGIISFVVIALSGRLVVSNEAYRLSNYFCEGKKIIILSVVCIAIYFVIYYLISRALFENKSERALFIGTVLLLHLFGFYSEEAVGFSIFLSPLTVQSIIVHDIMPLLLWLYLIYEDKIREVLYSEDKGYKETEESEEIPEEWDMKKHKILNIRNMAIAFVLMLVVFAASVFVLNSKINSLYDATVLLENAAKSKMTVYEMKGADGSVALTLMVSPDGTVTALGGGDKSNGTESCDFIRKNVEKIDKWYLYGSDDKNRGAYDFCISEGIEVTETYVVSGVEKLED